MGNRLEETRKVRDDIARDPFAWIHYQFPIIQDLEEARKAVQDREGFLIREREGVTLITYHVKGPRSFGPVGAYAPGERVVDPASSKANAIARECRGLAFNAAGFPVRRPIHKFFALREVREFDLDRIDLSLPHDVLEKLDGAMVSPLPCNSGFILATKGGRTRESEEAQHFIRSRPVYGRFIEEQEALGFTPIFEWCAKDGTHFVCYADDRLVLVALRRTLSGEYLQYRRMAALMEQCWEEIPFVKAVPDAPSTLADLAERAHTLSNEEGFVVRYHNGHMIKVKAKWWVEANRAVESIRSEKDFIALIVNETIDDVKTALPEAARERVQSFEDRFLQGVGEAARELEAKVREYTHRYRGDRGLFAREMQSSLSAIEAPLIFAAWNGSTAPREIILDYIRDRVHSGSRLDQVRSLWGGHHWEGAGIVGD